MLAARPVPTWLALGWDDTMCRMKGSGSVAWVAYLVVRTVFSVMQMFPIEWNLATARILARLWILVLPRHRDRAAENLRVSFGDKYSSEEIQRLADLSIENTAMFAVEAVCLPRLLTRFTWSRYVHLVDFRDALALMIEGRGAILVTGHFGSFELMGHLLACLGFRIAAVMRPLDNFYLNRFLVSTRKMNGLTLLDKKGAMTEAERIVRGGAMLAFIGDQDAGRKGMFVDFFGRQASTYKSIGLLAMETRRPIVVGYARRSGKRARYEVGVQRIIRPEEWEHQDDPLRWITAAYTTAVEDFIRAAPEQYLWAHRRWKSQPRRPRTQAPAGQV